MNVGLGRAGSLLWHRVCSDPLDLWQIDVGRAEAKSHAYAMFYTFEVGILV